MPLYAAPVAQTEQQPVEVMPFQFKHPDTGDAHAVALTRQEVADGMEDTLYEKLADLICHCEPVGETNVVDCNCDDYIYEFELVNAAPIAQTAPQDLRAIAMLVAEAAFKAGNGHDRSVASDTLREIVNSVFEQLGMQTAPQPEQSGLVEAVTPEIIDWVRCGLSVNGRLVDGTHPALEKLCAAYRAALSSTPSPAKRGEQ